MISDLLLFNTVPATDSRISILDRIKYTFKDVENVSGTNLVYPLFHMFSTVAVKWLTGIQQTEVATHRIPRDESVNHSPDLKYEHEVY